MPPFDLTPQIPQTERTQVAIQEARGRAGLYRTGGQVFADGLRKLRSLIKPKERITPSEWAEEYGYLSKESNSRQGKIKLYGFQREVLDAMGDPEVDQVTVLKGARVGYTRLITLLMGYYIEHDPSPVMLAQPTVGDVESFSGKEVLPMLRDTEVLKPLRRDIRRGEKQDTLTDIVFKNGASVLLRGAASDDAFRRVTTRINIGDEIDGNGWTPAKNGAQGNKLELFRTRGETFWNSKFIIGSTPLWLHSSRINAEFLKSDQRRYFVPCPHCGEYQYLEFGGKDTDHGLKWKVDEHGRVVDAWYQCKHNGCVIEEKHKRQMDAQGEWRPTAVPEKKGHRGYHMWTGMSLFPKAGWKFIAEDWLAAQRNPKDLQVFVNNRLGEPFQDRKEITPEFDVEGAKSSLEIYPAEVPDGVLVLTAGVDVQTGKEGSTKKEKGARLEVSIYGWGYGEEAWLIKHEIIPGAMDDPKTQIALDNLLKRPFSNRNGDQFWVQATAIDLGGHFTENVKSFANARIKRNVWAVKGRSLAKGQRSQSIWPKDPSKTKRDMFYMVDTQLAKDVLLGYRSAIPEPGPGYIHYPEGTDDRFFQGLASETRVQAGNGMYWQKTNKNAYGEPLDCLVYAYSALQGLRRVSKRWRNIDQVPAQINPVENPKKEQNVNDFNPSLNKMGDNEAHKPASKAAPPAKPARNRRRPATSNFVRR